MKVAGFSPQTYDPKFLIATNAGHQAVLTREAFENIAATTIDNITRFGHRKSLTKQVVAEDGLLRMATMSLPLANREEP